MKPCSPWTPTPSQAKYVLVLGPHTCFGEKSASFLSSRQWAILDWFFHLSVHLHKVRVAFSTAVKLVQLPGFPKVFLYARHDTLARDEIRHRFYRDDMATQFAHRNDIREFEALDGEIHHLGCTLAGRNCPVQHWLHRGWPMPPCCRRTLKTLLFYIHDVFTEMGIRYILANGALLGALKGGKIVIWDSDIDLEVHTTDFHRIGTDVRERVLKDGFFMRHHDIDKESYLLQANRDNYLLIELNKRDEGFDETMLVPLEGRLFPTHVLAAQNLSDWYGVSFLTNRLRHVPPWEELQQPLFCGTPFHHNCLEPHYSAAKDCRRERLC
eukprot:GEMP01041277.1.p1 GENE.GEMP01041277.1~~GEMP01041277.1.p1  ORF type:complete len:325 (+),score=59.67 GEMP01041277.1:812-1786(+)